MKVGDYVRTKKGILKIRDDKHFKDDKNKLNYLTYGNYTCVLKEDIINSSPNIIDLIEEDDFINQARVSEIIKKTKDSIRFMADSDYECSTELKEKEIKSIITKEQFESMEYRIGE